MSHGKPFMRGFAFSALLLASGGCSTAPSRVVPQQPDSQSSTAALAQYDENKDGQLDDKELAKAPGVKAALKKLDTNQDGKISADEITARLQAWSKSKTGRMTISCVVTRGGQPVAGASVHFVPEKFLGGQLKTGEGVTNQAGNASISVPNDKEGLPGLSPGFYRVEITKSGEQIPAAYNTETTLGVEVAGDSEAFMFGSLQFEIK